MTTINPDEASRMREAVARIADMADLMAQGDGVYVASTVATEHAADLRLLLADHAAKTVALKPFAEVSKKAKGKDDACWCGQDGAVIRYADLRRAEALSASKKETGDA